MDKKAIIGQKWSKILKLDVPNIGSKLAENGQEQDFNKVHLEKWRLGIVTRFKFVTIMYNLCKIT